MMGPKDSFKFQVPSSKCDIPGYRDIQAVFQLGTCNSKLGTGDLLPRPMIRPERMRHALGDLVQGRKPVAPRLVVLGVAGTGVERRAQRARDPGDVGRAPLAALDPDRD